MKTAAQKVDHIMNFFKKLKGFDCWWGDIDIVIKAEIETNLLLQLLELEQDALEDTIPKAEYDYILRQRDYLGHILEGGDYTREKLVELGLGEGTAIEFETFLRRNYIPKADARVMVEGFTLKMAAHMYTCKVNRIADSTELDCDCGYAKRHENYKQALALAQKHGLLEKGEGV